MSQIERIATRLEIMTNLDLSPNARVLFFLLDDKAGSSGECWWHWRKLAVAVGVNKGSFFRLVEELRRAKVLTVRHEDGRIFYAPISVRKIGLDSPKNRTAESEKSDFEARVSIYEPDHEPERPPNPLSGGLLESISQNPNATAEGYTLCPRCKGRRWQGRSEKRAVGCGWCSGRGFMWPAAGVERAS